ncbi:hypothetical protein HNP89_000945 [Methanococcus maripaludis]|uniref:AbiTii domain-containing protein n=1 Tax=Methanococcus maripaludis TaxID=39152 RepID=A0A7J9NZ73_METMI|nr:hypothetical protein [Methanococcus maripaludis]MBA2852988.1 hypothetical protein [Methanococcus maripaludis]
MSSLVLELQEKAKDPEVSISKLLWDAKRVAIKAKDPEFEKWINNELNGYNSSIIPPYRKVNCKLVYKNISSDTWAKYLFGDPNLDSKLSSLDILTPIEELTNDHTNDPAHFEIPPYLESSLYKLHKKYEFSFEVDSDQIKRIINAVRRNIYDFTLKLERKGILTEDDKTSLSNPLPDSLPLRIINISKRIFADTDNGLSGSRIGEFFDEIIEELGDYKPTEEFYTGSFSSKKELFAHKLKHLPLKGQILALYLLCNNSEFKMNPKTHDLKAELDTEVQKLGLENEFKKYILKSTSKASKTTIFRESDFLINDKLVFIICPFCDPFDEICNDHIKPLVTSSFEDMVCVRADDIFYHRAFMDKVWKCINEARIIIADLTGRRANVFYELGIANALGKDVILLTQNMDDVPSDIHHIECIEYDLTPEGIEYLEHALKETMTTVLGKKY